MQVTEDAVLRSGMWSLSWVSLLLANSISYPCNLLSNWKDQGLYFVAYISLKMTILASRLDVNHLCLQIDHRILWTQFIAPLDGKKWERGLERIKEIKGIEWDGNQMKYFTQSVVTGQYKRQSEENEQVQNYVCLDLKVWKWKKLWFFYNFHFIHSIRFHSSQLNTT